MKFIYVNFFQYSTFDFCYSQLIESMWKHGYTKGNVRGLQNFMRNSNSHMWGGLWMKSHKRCECGIDMAFKT